MPRGVKNIPIDGLFCPACGSESVHKRVDKAQSGRARYKCQACGTRTTRPLSEPPQILPKFKKQTGCKRFIVTSALNDQPVVADWFTTLEGMAKELDAQLVVIATIYKNPDLARQGFLESLSWPSEVLPYICQERFIINKNLTIAADWRISATAINPLQGCNHSAGTTSEIFGHAQVAHEVIPTPKDSVPKCLWTTGSVTQVKGTYGGSPQAKKAEFHHSLSAILVEVVGDKFWVTNLHWDGTGCQHLDRYYTPKRSKRGERIPAVAYGDWHVDVMSKKEARQVVDIARGLRPEVNIAHDILDMHTGSHHKVGDVLHNLRHPDCDVRGELERTIDYMRKIGPGKLVCISSNHNEHLEQYFNRFKPQSAPAHQLDFYYELADLARKSPGGLFELYCKSRGVDAEFPDRNKEYDLCGVDCAQHGDKGPNGAPRGSGKSFARTGRKTVTAHSHTPGINKGNYTVGTSAMGMSYAKGYSSWLICHCIIYKSGKRALFYSIMGKLSPMTQELIDRRLSDEWSCSQDN